MLFIDIVGCGEDMDRSVSRNLDNTFVDGTNLDYRLSGKVLISIIPAIPHVEVVIPEGVVAIVPGAITNCKLKRLVLPKTLRVVLGWPISDSTIEELVVQEWDEITLWNYGNSHSTIGVIKKENGDSVPDGIEIFWRNNVDPENIIYLDEEPDFEDKTNADDVPF